MKQREEKLFLQDIIDFCEHIAAYIKDVDKAGFLSNRMLQDALVRKIEIIGEAVKNISNETRQYFPHVAWKEIAGMRDRIAHGYFNVDLDIVWKTVTQFIPKLKPEIEKILESFPVIVSGLGVKDEK
jgi:uncharacterized protein with HEPN domain